MGFKSHYPARGRKLRLGRGLYYQRLRFKSHYPARGRKPVVSYETHSNSFKSHYPARGRKPQGFPIFVYDPNGSNLITPQGDGNNISDVLAVFICAGSNLITPQGDGNHREQFQFQFGLQLFKSHYPARGRKLPILPMRCPAPIARSNLITPQGDGNVIKTRKLIPLSESSNLITPQGDGNALASYHAP